VFSKDIWKIGLDSRLERIWRFLRESNPRLRSDSEQRKKAKSPMTHPTGARAPSDRDTNHSENSEDERSDQ